MGSAPRVRHRLSGRSCPPIPAEDIAYIADNMRAVDVFESRAVGTEPGEGLEDLANFSDVSALTYIDDRPVFITGAIQVLPGVFTWWGVGTDETRRAMPHITRLGRQLIDQLFVSGQARRIQISIPYDPQCQVNIDWLINHCGARLESVASYATALGGPMAILVITIKDYERRVQDQSAEVGADSRTGPCTGSGTSAREVGCNNSVGSGNGTSAA
jgi:hypothetical protein